MVRGVYHAASAMLSQMIKQDVHAHNLANADTTGFKRCLTRIVTAQPGASAQALTSSTDFAQGDVRPTGCPLDVALKGRGYFVVDTGSGRQYTRDGHFSINSTGTLVNSQGLPVLGRGGQIALSAGEARIAEDGGVYSGGRLVDKPSPR